MRRIALIATLCAAVPAVGMAGTDGGAEPWQDVPDEAGVRAALEGKRLVYDSGAWQEFRASGKTLYNAGRDSWGNWRAQGRQYCSEWPPAGGWTCYDLQIRAGQVRFIGSGDDITVGCYKD